MEGGQICLQITPKQAGLVSLTLLARGWNKNRWFIIRLLWQPIFIDCNIWFHGVNVIFPSKRCQRKEGQTYTVSWSTVYPQISRLRLVLSPGGELSAHAGAIQQAQSPSTEREPSLAAAVKSVPPGFHQHFSPHWWENSGGGQKLYILYKHSPERQHTDSFFGVCENGGGPLSAPLCWCLSTV